MTTNTFLFINLIDPLHNGAGQGLGPIDRPVIRERTTGFPLIQPTSLKGALRGYYDKKWANEPNGPNKVVALFGPESGKGESHAGAISFGEGQLLAFPVRSLKGCFIWATSPLILHRFAQKMELAEIPFPQLTRLLPTLYNITQPLICQGSENLLLMGEGPSRSLLLEEFSFNFTSSPELKIFADEMAGKVFPKKLNDLKAQPSYLSKIFKQKLVVLPEDIFGHFAQHALEVTPNIAIGNNGVTTTGSLRYTEYAPRESIFYSLLLHEKAASPGKYSYDPAILGLDEESKVKSSFEASLPGKIQIGGDETVGKGQVELVRWR